MLLCDVRGVARPGIAHEWPGILSLLASQGQCLPRWIGIDADAIRPDPGNRQSQPKRPAPLSQIPPVSKQRCGSRVIVNLSLGVSTLQDGCSCCRGEEVATQCFFRSSNHNRGRICFCFFCSLL